MFGFIETAFSSEHYYLVFWPFVFALAFVAVCSFLGKGGGGQDSSEILSVGVVVVLISELFLGSYICSTPTLAGRVPIPGAETVFWLMAVTFLVVIITLVIILRVSIRLLDR